MQIVLVAVLGVFGTLSRYGMQGWVQHRAAATFPMGTLAVNLLGCFLIGGVNRLALAHLWFPPEWRIALTIGFLGAFTTFSSFAYETLRLMEDGEWGRASLYVGVSVAGGLICVALGMKAADLL